MFQEGLQSAFLAVECLFPPPRPPAPCRDIYAPLKNCLLGREPTMQTKYKTRADAQVS